MNRRQDPRLNRWLTSTVDTYLKEYGLSEKPLIYEVGSRDGHDCRELSQRIHNNFPNVGSEDVTMVLFECNPPSIETIKQNYPEATLITDAISNISGKTVEFLQMKGDQNIVGSSSMDLNRVNEPWLKDYEIIKVKTKRLDEVIEQLGHQNTEIDIVKIDVEHYSYQALLSMGKYLRNARVLHVETEIEGSARAESNLDILYFMEKNGFKLMATESEWGDPIQDHIYLRVDL